MVNIINGDENDNILFSSFDLDIIDGKGGKDTISYVDSILGVNVNLTTGLGVGGNIVDVLSNMENVDGSVHDDVITGDAGSNVLKGDAGNDTIYGGSGNDFITGGTGNDAIYGGVGDDDYSFDLGDGTDSLSDVSGVSDITFESGTFFWDMSYIKNGDNLELAYNVDDSNDKVVLEDYFVSGSAVDKLVFAENSGRSYLSDLQFGTSGDDVISGDTNGVSNDILYGDAGSDTLNGLQGSDLINGGSGNDILNGGDRGDYLHGDEGDDTINGDAGNDFSYGGAGNDTLNGGDGSDFLEGGAGNDNIDGGDKHDSITGGAGADILTGGFGRDIFVYDDTTESSGSNIDVIKDFEVNIDHINLSAISSVDFASLSIVDNGVDTVVSHSNGLEILLEGILSSALDSGDFIF